jgi:hypothetical protein
VTKNLSRPFLLFSVLGIAWGLAHVGLEVLTGKPLLKLGLPFTLLWAAVLVQALRGRRWAALTAVLLGDLGCYWVAVMHFQGADWSGVLPWKHNPEHAGPLWVIPYNVLVYAGLLVGLGLLWTGMRVVRGIRFALVVSGVLVASSVAFPPRGVTKASRTAARRTTRAWRHRVHRHGGSATFQPIF